MLLAIATWPVDSIAPSPGLDQSWGGALHMAARDGLRFGTDINFTYGPLGFLAVPKLWFGVTGALAFAFVAALHAAAIGLLVMSARARPGDMLWGVAMIVALLALTVVGHSRLPLIVATLVAFVVIRGEPDGRLVRWYPILAGIAAGAMLLVKVNDGVGVLAVSVIAVIGLSAGGAGRRPVIAFGVATVVSVLVCWMATGQSFADLPPFVAGSAQLASGYNSAMGLESPGRAWEYAAAAIGAAGLMALAAESFGRTDRARLVSALAILAAVAFLTFKHGFVRHDGHAVDYFATAAILAVPFARIGSPRAAVVVGVLAVSLFLSLGRNPLEFIDPLRRGQAFATQAITIALPDQRERFIADQRLAMQARYALDGATQAELDGRTVHVEPYETAVAWAFYASFEWRPLPTFQPYLAYTAGLDELNARAVAAEDAPERILRENASPFDGRLPQFEPPATTLAILCHYRELTANERWQVLGRADDRCGQPRLIERQEAVIGELIEVPRAGADEIVYATVDGVRSGIGERLRALVYRSEPVIITFSGQADRRLVPETASNPLVISVPDTLGYSPPFEYPAEPLPFRIWYPDAYPDRTRIVVVEFFAVELRD